MNNTELVQGARYRLLAFAERQRAGAGPAYGHALNAIRSIEQIQGEIDALRHDIKELELLEPPEYWPGITGDPTGGCT